MKKILLLTNDLRLSRGGQELANYYLLKILQDKSLVDIVDQVFFPQNNSYEYITKISNYIPISFNNFFKGITELIFILIKKNKIDYDYVIISSTPFSTLLYIFFIKIFRFFRKARIIHWCHIDPYQSLFTASRITYILLVLSKIFYKTFDYIVVTNPDMKKVFEEKYGVSPKKIKLITYPLREDLNEMLREDIKLNFKRPIIISVIRLETNQKDPETLIKAFNFVKKKIKTANLLLLGDGPDKKKLINLSKSLGLKKDVHFFGFVKNPLTYVKKSDVFVLSSRTEGTPIVLIEALATKVPVIATNCPIGPKWILKKGKAGFLTEVGDEKEMAEKILWVLNRENKEKVKKIIDIGFKRIDYFSFSNFKKRWFNFLKI